MSAAPICAHRRQVGRDTGLANIKKQQQERESKWQEEAFFIYFLLNLHLCNAMWNMHKASQVKQWCRPYVQMSYLKPWETKATALSVSCWCIMECASVLSVILVSRLTSSSCGPDSCWEWCSVPGLSYAL